MIDLLKNVLLWIFGLSVLFGFFGASGCSLTVESPGSSFAAEQNLDGSGTVDASGEVHVAWELPVVSTIGDLFVGFGTDNADGADTPPLSGTTEESGSD